MGLPFLEILVYYNNLNLIGKGESYETELFGGDCYDICFPFFSIGDF